MRRRHRLPSCLLFATFAASSLAGQVAGTASTIDGRELPGRLTVAADGVCQVLAADGGKTTFELAQLAGFERDDVEPRIVETEDRVWLRSGLELPAKKIKGRLAADGKPAVLLARLPSGLEVTLPISTVRAIRHGGLLRPRPTLFATDLAKPPANNDLLYVVKGGRAQRSSVAIQGLTSKAVEFKLRGDDYEFEIDGVAAVVFGANTGFAPNRQPQPRTVVSLTTGEKLEGKMLSLGESLRLRLDEGCELDVPLRNLHRLDVSSDKLVWLSKLEPKVEQTPAFDRVWPWHKNRTEGGPGFQLAGQSFERGIGLVPKTRLTYAVEGRYDVFEATIGIDDRGGPQAHAVFRVFVDGQQAFESEPMTRGMPPQELHVALNKAQTLAIEVDFGKNYDLGDFCAFADARIVQQ
ncbi:MAG: NPCBM/NEW2 domain-containing protein [Planctomycetota bacterium]